MVLIKPKPRVHVGVDGPLVERHVEEAVAATVESGEADESCMDG